MIINAKKICHKKIFEKIFQTYAKDLRRFIFFKTKDADQTEDILQDCFVKLWENCINVDYDKVKPYLYKTANNLFLNIVKHNSVKQKHKHSLAKHSTNESPEYLMIEKEFYDKIKKAIANLPEKQREVFLLNRIDKKTYKDIAKTLDISVKAVEKRMHLALKTMRKTIGNV
ncbi:MAG: RNA polymerase sigma-70 factor [Flavobacteriaceae bacterium]|nr:RNA polymerase sigma-70 factor [Flavobacteriaceae bacterium]